MSKEQQVKEATLSVLELDFLKETFELVLEEFEGIEEGKDNLEDYVLTTGALENVKEADELITSLYDRVHYVDPEEGLE